MALTLKSPLRTRERILMFGVQGTGKSNGILSIASKIPDANFFIIDNDVSPSYNRALDSEFSGLDNVQVFETDPDDWKDGLDMAKKLSGEVGYNDWLVFDSISTPWAAVQSWFIETLHGVEEADYFMNVREAAKKLEDDPKAKSKSSLGALEGWMDWPVINKEYFKLTKTLFKTRGHLYLTAEMGKTNQDDDSEVKELFGPYGVKPVGQKRLGYMPQTVLLTTKSRVGEYKLTTIKDRNRREMEGEMYGDFAKDYLMKVGRWTRAVVKNDGGDGNGNGNGGGNG